MHITLSRGLVGLLFLVFPFFLSAQNIVYVDTEANGNNNGTSWINAYNELRVAIANTTCGVATEFRIAEGKYLPTNTLDRNASFILCNNWKLVGGYPTGGGNGTTNPLNFPSILSGNIGTENNLTDNAYHVIRITNTNETLQLEGLQIADGNASGAGDDDKGGGVYIDGSGQNNSSNPLFTNCVFRNNQARNGGAVYNYGAMEGEVRPRFDNCFFIQNQSDIGGAIFNAAGNNGNASPIFTDCTFFENTAQFNGGAINESSDGGGFIGSNYFDCTFDKNWAVQFHGGAIASSGFNGDFNYNVDRCRFVNNLAGDRGGAVYALTPKSSFSNSEFVSNQATRGGVFYVFNTTSSLTLLSLNNTFHDNQGSGGVIFYEQNSTAQAGADFINCIIWGNTSVAGTSGTVNVSHINISNSIIQGSSWLGGGSNNIFSDPMFKDAPNNLSLNSNSPAVNSGNNNVPVFVDLRGISRPQGGTLDIGAYEFSLSQDGLSLDWVNFTAQQQQQEVILHWATANEKDNLDFVIERANSNQDFTAIGQVKAKNTVTARYRFVDKTPLIGNNLYRIAQRNMDGTTTYSTIQSVDYDYKNTVQIFPNPTTDKLQVTGVHQENIQVEVYDLQQRLILQTTDLQYINLPKAGLYTLKIYQNNQLIKVEKVVRY